MTDGPVILDEGSFMVGFLLASQLIGYGRFLEADGALDHAAALAGSDDRRALVAAVQASNRFWRLADAGGAHAVLDAAADRIGDDRARDGVSAQRAVLLLFEGRVDEARRLGAAVVGRGGTTEAGRLLAAGAATLASGLLGSVDDRPVLPPPPAPEPAGSSAPDGLARFQYGVLGLTIGLAGAFNGVDPVITGDPPATAPARAAGTGACEGTADLVDATNLLWAGRPRSALTVLERADTHLRASDRFHIRPFVHGQAAYAHALLGDADAAARAAADAERHRHPVSRLDTFFIGRGQAWAAAVRGEGSAARERLVATAAACERWEQPVLAAQAWYDLARLGAADRAAPPLGRLAAAVGGGPDSPVVRLAAHTAALAGEDAAGVGRASTAARRHGHILFAAEAAAQAASLHGRRRRADADRWAATARALAGACEGAGSPPLAALTHLDLTHREREIIGLVAQGLSSPAIAGRLHLSVRTVENHLQSGFGKLGVHRREELAHLHPFGIGGDGSALASDPDGAGAAVDADGDDDRL